MGERERTGKKTCFVITPIGEEGSDIRKRADQLLEHIVRPVTESLGYETTRADLIAEPGVIRRQVIQHVVDSSLVIADLTGHNPNVFYELAVRHAARKPYVQMINKGEPIPFDVADNRTISFDIHDLDSVAVAKKELLGQVKSIEDGKTGVDSPISVAWDTKIMKESENPTQRMLAQQSEAIAEIGLALRDINQKISSIGYAALQETAGDRLFRAARRFRAIREEAERARAMHEKGSQDTREEDESKQETGVDSSNEGIE